MVTETWEWAKGADGKWTRPLFANEIFMAVKSQFDGCCTLYTTITISGSTLHQIQEAWRRVSMLHPALRMTIRRDDSAFGALKHSFGYKTPLDPCADLAAWGARTLRCCADGSQEELLSRAIAERNTHYPVVRPGEAEVARLYASQATGEHSLQTFNLVFAFHHAIADARGQWMVIDTFLQILSGKLTPMDNAYSWGTSDLKLLPRPFHYQAGLRQDGDAPPVDPFVAFAEFEKTDLPKGSFASFPNLETSPPSSSQTNVAPINILTVAPQDYTLLHRVAKRHGCTASAWVGALLTIIYYRLNIVEDVRTFRFPLQPVDARRHLPPDNAPYSGLAIGGGDVDMTDLKLMEQASQETREPGAIPASFWSLALQYKEGLQKLVDDKPGVLAAKEIVAAICPFVLADPSIGDRSSIFYTSLGRAGGYIQPSYNDILEVGNLATFPLFHNTLLVMCSLLEFNGELRIIYQIPGNTYSAEFANRFANELQTLLTRLVEGAASCAI